MMYGSLLLVVALVRGVAGEQEGCAHPAVPAGAFYTNMTGGLGQEAWKIKYKCDIGYELFGSAERECRKGEWRGDLPSCSVNVAKFKPADSSSTTGGGAALKAVDGVVTTVHEGTRCTETKSELSPWWSVDLLTVQAVKHVRITTRCCDDLVLKNIEIRVGNSTTYKDNPMCNWIPGSLDQGDTKTVECVSDDANGRYVSISMTGVEGVLSLCEVEVFSPDGLGVASCNENIKTKDVSVYDESCYWFVKNSEGEQDNLGFVEAAQTCDTVGYHLAYEIDEEAASFMRHRLAAEGRAEQGSLVWIGAEKDPKRPGQAWNWVTGGSVSGIFWGPQQPNNYANKQNCAVLDSEMDWRWNDISCTVDAKAICKGPASRCASPPVGEGSWAGGERKLGSSLLYHCPIGYKPNGQKEQFCLSTGGWSGEPISCEFVDCGDVPGLLQGAVHYTDGRTNYGARMRYECNANYTLRGGSAERTCDDGGWTGSPPLCEQAVCKSPGLVPNAKLKEIPGTAGINTLGAKLIYTCDVGHVASGSLSRECKLGGDWSGETPVCKFVDCGNPRALENGNFELLNGRTTYGAEIEYTCTPDYNIQGNVKTRCEADGRWSRNTVSCSIVRCPTPRAPAGGKVSGYNYEVHRKVEYSCISGHRLVGDPVLECQRSGKWSSKPPRCQFVDCRRLGRLEGGRVRYMNETTHLGSVVEFVCDRSHQLEGASSLTCMEDERWRDAEGRVAGTPTCVETRCAGPVQPNNTVVSVSSTERLHGTSVLRSKVSKNDKSFSVGSQLKYRCKRGFVINNGQRVVTRVCEADGQWTNEAPVCTYVDCERPPELENGAIILQNQATAYGSTAQYTCDLGWKLDGFSKRTCLGGGNWAPDAPVCQETLCSTLTQPANAIMNLTTLRIGGLATFSCEHGYKLIGDSDLNCLDSGSWSGWPPSCVEIDCGEPPEVDNGKIFLVDKSTRYQSIVEYHCDAGYTREGPFKRECELNGYWSGQNPVCYLKKRAPIKASLPKKNVRAGSINDVVTDKESSASNVGVWIGVALGLIVVIGLLIGGIYFYKKQQAFQGKPSRDNNANGLGVLGVPSFAGGGGGAGPGGFGPGTTQIGGRPPPPIQMYSIEDSDDHRGPIYDTINDGDSGHSSYSHGSNHSGQQPQRPRSTFSPTAGGGGPTANGGYTNDYDVPEGGAGKNGGSPVGTVTINGIAV